MENKKKLYYIEGCVNYDANSIKKIRETFSKLNVKFANGFVFNTIGAMYVGVEGSSLYMLNIDYDTAMSDYIKSVGINIIDILKGTKEHTFKPFDKVLVRDSDGEIWRCQLYSHYDEGSAYPHRTTLGGYKQCIPFEGNEHLVGTVNNP